MRKYKSHFKNQISFALKHLSFKDCPYYPCHKMPEGKELNCFFCFCPFYPCKGKIGDGKWIKSTDGKKIWDCSDCTFIHRDDVVDRILELLYENKKFKRIKRIIKKEFCR